MSWWRKEKVVRKGDVFVRVREFTEQPWWVDDDDANVQEEVEYTIGVDEWESFSAGIPDPPPPDRERR